MRAIRARRSSRRDPGISAAGRAAAAARPDAAQHFRAALSGDGRRRAALRHRLIGMIQPDPAHPGADQDKPQSVSRRLRRAHDAIRRERRRPLSDPAHRRRALSRRRGAWGHDALPAVPRDLSRLRRRLHRAQGEDGVDRKALLRALTAFLKANNLKADWEASRRRRTRPGQCAGDDAPLTPARSRRCWRRRT